MFDKTVNTVNESKRMNGNERVLYFLEKKKSIYTVRYNTCFTAEITNKTVAVFMVFDTA